MNDNHQPLESKEAARRRIEQAQTLKPIAAENGLKFEVYLPSDLGAWILDLVEKGDFLDPSEAVFVFMKQARELDPHNDLKQELLKRTLDKRTNSDSRTYTIEEVKAQLEESLKHRPDPVSWKKIPLDA
ncbi:MAG: hypothetical protein AAGB46_06180 [Verrucomicrobiota bacterium]